jgi:plastocyanin
MTTTKRFLAALLIAFTLIALQRSLAAASYGSRPTSRPAKPLKASVRIENFSFLPRELEIAVGTTVTWQNADDVPHTATSKDDPQVFDSGPLDTDDKFSFTFTKPGKFAYYCKVHPHMTGVVIVK